MKRLVAIILSCVFLFGFSSSLAEGVDLSSMSLEELQTLNKAINAEINNRFGKSLGYIGSGVFVVGKDIKAGTYNLINIDVTETEFSSRGTINLYLNEEMHKESEEYDYFQVYDGSTVTVSLKDGMVITLNSVKAEVEECSAAWMLAE